MRLETQLRFDSYMIRHKTKTAALFHALKDGIVEGRFPSGSKLPSSRELAEDYQLSRGTVNVAYEMLHAQGYVRSEVGRGTFVVYHVVSNKGKTKEVQVEPISLSAWGTRVQQFSLLRSSGIPDEGHIDFALGRSDMSFFPVKDWNRVLYEQVRRMADQQQINAYESEGHGPLRESIAYHLRRTRGLMIEPQDVIIMNGSQQVLTLLVQLLIDPGDVVVMENPTYRGTMRAVQAAGGRIYSCPVDRQGIRMDNTVSAKLAIVTPGRQFPTGAVLSMERRLALLQWAKDTGAWIIEDDYDSEFRFHGRPMEPLKALDHGGKVAFIGTFSRTLLQDIRIGYAVLPSSFVDLVRKAKQLYDTHPPAILEQRALAEFMQTGQYERHLRRMRRVYKRRGELLYELLTTRLRRWFDVHESEAGLHLYAEWLGKKEWWDQYLLQCEQEGVRFPDMRITFFDHPKPSAAFGFAHLNEEQLAEGVERLVLAAK